jgi:AcrR family transcriptional regulator
MTVREELDGLPREFSSPIPRDRLLAAAVRAVTAVGYPAATVGSIAREASLSSKTFYEYFAGKEDCVLIAYDLIVEWFGQRISAAVDEVEDWTEAVRATVEVALTADPRLVRFCATDIIAVGSLGVARYQASIQRLASGLHSGRDRCEWGADLPGVLEETVVGGAVWLAGNWARVGRGDELVKLVPDFTYFLTTPYLGAPEREHLLAGRGPSKLVGGA